MTNSTLPAANETWGFYGTSGAFADADQAWSIAFPAVLAATEGTAEGVRDFLDSGHGRHFADDVHNGIHAGLDLTAAIEAAITRWMGWKIDQQTARDIAMPKGLPYLKGFVQYFAAEANRMSASVTSSIRFAICALPAKFHGSLLDTVLETIEQELYEGGVYACATADNSTIEITVRTDQLLDTANALSELELI